MSLLKITTLLCSVSIIKARIMEGSLNGVILNGRGGLGRLQRHLEGRDNVSYYPNGDPYWAYRTNWGTTPYQYPNQYQSYQNQYYQNYQNQYQYQRQYQYPQYQQQYQTAYQPQYYQQQRYATYPTYKTGYPSNSYVMPYGYYPKRM